MAWNQILLPLPPKKCSTTPGPPHPTFLREALLTPVLPRFFNPSTQNNPSTVARATGLHHHILPGFCFSFETQFLYSLHELYIFFWRTWSEYQTHKGRACTTKRSGLSGAVQSKALRHRSRVSWWESQQHFYLDGKKTSSHLQFCPLPVLGTFFRGKLTVVSTAYACSPIAA